MDKINSEVLTAILKKNRIALNQQFIFARHLDRTLDGEVFSSYLVKVLEPLVEHHRNRPPDQLEKVTIHLYSQILSLYSRHFLASEGRYPFFEDVFLELLEHYREHLFDHPKIFTQLGNSTLKMAQVLGKDVERWSSLLRQTPYSHCDALLKQGYVAAWVSGYAPYRQGALAYLQEMDMESFKALLELQEFDLKATDRDGIMKNLALNCWYHPSSVLKEEEKSPVFFTTVGGFKGFDQAFILPPRVFEYQGHIAVTDTRNTFLLFADAFGQQLIPVDRIEDMPPTPKYESFPIMIVDGMARLHDQTLDMIPILNLAIKSKVFSNRTCFFTSHSSYKVFIFGIQGDSDND